MKNRNPYCIIIGIFLFGFLIFVHHNVAFAVGTCDDGYRVNLNQTVEVDCHGVCQRVNNNNCGNDLFVPTKTSAEWEDFRNHAPSCVSFNDCVVNSVEIPGIFEDGYLSALLTCGGPYAPSNPCPGSCLIDPTKNLGHIEVGTLEYCDNPGGTIDRGYIGFDTSSIPDEAVITSAYLELGGRIRWWGRCTGDARIGYFDINVYPSWYGPVLNNADWGAWDNTKLLGSINIADLVVDPISYVGPNTAEYGQINLNNVSTIDTTGITYFALVASIDVGLNDPDSCGHLFGSDPYWTYSNDLRFDVYYQINPQDPDPRGIPGMRPRLIVNYE